MSKPRLRKNTGAGDFGQRLRGLRIQKNLQQQELAGLVGVSVVQYGRYERGVSLPAAEMLQRLANALGVSGDYLLGGADAGAARADFEDLELLQLFQEVQDFPKDDKTLVKKILEAFIVKRKLQRLVS